MAKNCFDLKKFHVQAYDFGISKFFAGSKDLFDWEFIGFSADRNQVDVL